jgi:hypothetical protein
MTPRDPTEAEKVIIMNARNILKEMKAGKTLTQAKLRQVEEAKRLEATLRGDEEGAKPDWAQTWEDIQRWTGLNNDKLAKLKKLKGFPKKNPHKGYNIADIVSFVEKFDSDNGLTMSAEAESLRDQKTREEIRLLQLKAVADAVIKQFLQ